MYIIKHLGSYYTDKFEIDGVVLMVSHSNVREDAKVFNTKEEIEEELKNVKNYDYEIEEI
jgi:hypothetical protein